MGSRWVQRIMIGLAALALLAGWGPAARAQTPDSGAALKAAVQAHITQTEHLVLDHIEIRRVIGDYAWVVAYPNLRINETDPASVILQRRGGTWQILAGPGTAFVPSEDFPTAPPALYDDNNPYTDEAGAAALARIGGAHRVYADAGVRFEYPADASLQQAGHVTQLLLIGPALPAPQGTELAYHIAVTRLAQPVQIPLDEWGYAQAQQETADRTRAGLPHPAPDAATFFHVGAHDVYQIDWSTTDSPVREFFVAPRGGGPMVQLSTPVYPAANPAGPLTESAVTLLLNTLTIPGTEITPGMPRTGTTGPPMPGGVLVAAALLLLLGWLGRRRAPAGQ